MTQETNETKLVSQEKPGETWPNQSWGNSFTKRWRFPIQNNPICSKSNFSYQTELWILQISFTVNCCNVNFSIHALQNPIEDLNLSTKNITGRIYEKVLGTKTLDINYEAKEAPLSLSLSLCFFRSYSLFYSVE